MNMQNYEEILKCYYRVTPEHAAVAYDFKIPDSSSYYQSYGKSCEISQENLLTEPGMLPQSFIYRKDGN